MTPEQVQRGMEHYGKAAALVRYIEQLDRLINQFNRDGSSWMFRMGFDKCVASTTWEVLNIQDGCMLTAADAHRIHNALLLSLKEARSDSHAALERMTVEP